MNLKKNVIFLNFQTCKNIQRTLKCTILNMFLLYNGMGSSVGFFSANNNKNETKIVCGNTIVFLQKYNNNKKKWCHEATTTWCSCVINGIVALFLLVVVFKIYINFSHSQFFFAGIWNSVAWHTNNKIFIKTAWQLEPDGG